MEMKKLALAVALAASFGSAHASGLYIDSPTGSYTINEGNLDNPVVPFAVVSDVVDTTTAGVWGRLGATHQEYVSFTFLGSSSGYNNSFKFSLGSLGELDTIGETLTATVMGAGLLDFSFINLSNGSSFSNISSTFTTAHAFTIVDAHGVNGFDYYIGYNDNGVWDTDYNDFLVGVSTSEVPVPAALPLMASGLGLLGFAGFRRKSAA